MTRPYIMTHTFPFDPSTILGVSAGASLGEIRDAYRQKSLKHHPDKGGDEWAFRLVSQAYEILSTARVVHRADEDFTRHRPSPTPHPQPHSHPHQADHSAKSGGDYDPSADLKNWGGALQSHEGDSPEAASKIVSAELLILRFELECSIDLFARSPESRNLSCSIHVAWPVVGLAESATTLPNASRTLKKLAEAFKAKSIRKHALKEQSSVEQGRFEGWLTYPTAVLASEALEALGAVLGENDLILEKKVRQMAIPRPRG
jgi:curved DNA-binding protein CbpA